MKIRRSTIHPLLALPVLFAFSARADDVRYGPAAGTTIKKTFTTSEEITLDEMSVVTNGQEMDPEMTKMEQDLSMKTEIVLIDKYVAVADGRPTTLERKYEKLGGDVTMEMSHAMMGDTKIETTAESELEGETVTFVWNEDEEGYELKLAEDSTADEALLTDLVEDTDLRGFLPSGEVKEGDTWTVEPEAMRGVLAYGGSLKMEHEAEGGAGDMMGLGGSGSGMPPPDAFLGEIEGTIAAEYRGTRDEGGVRVGIIHLKVDITTAKDMTAFFEEAMKNAEMPEGMDVDMEYNSVDIEFDLSGEGTLLWNLAGGYAHSFELQSDVTMGIDMAMSMTVGGMGEMSNEISVVMKGTQNVDFSAAPAGS